MTDININNVGDSLCFGIGHIIPDNSISLNIFNTLFNYFYTGKYDINTIIYEHNDSQYKSEFNGNNNDWSISYYYYDEHNKIIIKNNKTNFTTINKSYVKEDKYPYRYFLHSYAANIFENIFGKTTYAENNINVEFSNNNIYYLLLLLKDDKKTFHFGYNPAIFNKSDAECIIGKIILAKY